MLLFVALRAMYPSVTACAVPPPFRQGRLYAAVGLDIAKAF